MRTQTKIRATTLALGTNAFRACERMALLAEVERALGRRLFVRAAVNLLLVGAGCVAILVRGA